MANILRNKILKTGNEEIDPFEENIAQVCFVLFF